MKRALKWIGAVFLIALIGLGIVAYTPDSDPDQMIADYGQNGGYIDGVDGMRVFTREFGCADCPALILIHGSNSNSLTWASLIRHLQTDWRIITYDQPGHGLTGPHPDHNYTARGMHQALSTVMNAKGLDDAILVGSSMGGWTSWTFAALHPDRVRGLVLISASGMPISPDAPERERGFVYHLLATPGLNQLLTSITPQSFVEDALRKMVVDDSYIEDAHIETYWRMLRMPGNRRATLDRAATQRDQDLQSRLRNYDGPVQLIWGRQDPTVDVSAAAVFQNRLPQAQAVIFDDIGHLPMEESPANVAAAMQAFFANAGLSR